MDLQDWRARVQSHLPPLTLEREPEIVEELAQHLADLYADAIASGRSDQEAIAIASAALPAERERLARDLTTASRALPGLIAQRWLAPDEPPANATRRFRILHDVRRDVTYAFRVLLRSRGFSAVAVLTLALGIGANSAIFAAVDTILLRPLPYRHAQRLVVPASVNQSRGIDQASISFADYMDWRQQTDVFDVVALWRPSQVDLAGQGDPERVTAAQVSEEYFRLADVTPLAGRVLVPADHEAKAPRVTVITHGLWQRRFGGASTVGSLVRIGGTPHQIVGVLPPRSVWPDDVALFLPLPSWVMDEEVRTRRDNLIFLAIARLRDGVAIGQGDAVLATIASRLEREHPESRKGWTNRLVPLRDYIVEADLRQALVVLLAAVAAVLLIACANLANLVLVRGIGRARELGLRFALGATRWRVVRQLTIESLVLATLGGTAGLAMAVWMIRGLVSIAPDGTPFVEDIGLDVRVVAATAAFSVVAVVIAGLMPAAASSSVHLGAALKEGSSGAGASRRTTMLRNALIVGEVATAVMLLTTAAVLMRSFSRVTRIDPGVDIDRVLTARLSLPGARYPTDAHSAAFFRQVIDRLSATPGVEAAAATSFVPVGGGGFGLGRVFLAEGWPEPPAGPDVGAQWNVVTPDYFRAVGIPVLQGRPFDARDRADSPPVMVVSRSFATAMFGGANPIGKRTRSWRDENVLREIVGVVDEVRYSGLADRERLRQVYVPHEQDSWNLMSVILRSASGPPEALAAALRREVVAIDPELALARVQTLAGVARDSIARERYTTLLLGMMAAAALGLGAIGIYGVVSYAVSLRRRELGIRVALGASRRHVHVLVFRYGFRLMALGLATGLAGSMLASRWLSSLLFDTRPIDTLAYTASVATILVATALACLVPARRAAAADPIAALRAE